MSWMRSPVYAWGDGRRVHLWARADEADAHAFDPGPVDDPNYPGFTGGIVMREDVYDALVMMRYAELCGDDKAFRRAVRRARKERGNLGSWDLLEALGEDPAAAFRAKLKRATEGRAG